MNDFFDGLVNRLFPNAGAIQPRQPYRFELTPPQPEGTPTSQSSSMAGRVGRLMRAIKLPETQTVDDSELGHPRSFEKRKRFELRHNQSQFQVKDTAEGLGTSIHAPIQTRPVQVNDPLAGEDTVSSTARSEEISSVEPAQNPKAAGQDRGWPAPRALIEASHDHQRVVASRRGVLIPSAPVQPSTAPAVPSQVVSSPMRAEASSANQVVVRIGRLEVKAVKPVKKQRSKRREQPIRPMGLDEYARRRNKDQSR
jgi:hypothetical protein